MLVQRLMWIAWPAFLLAGVIEMLVFALVDPRETRIKSTLTIPVA